VVHPQVACRQSLSGGADNPNKIYRDSEVVSEEAWRDLIHTDISDKMILQDSSECTDITDGDHSNDQDLQGTKQGGRHEQIKEHLKHLKEVHLRDLQQDSNAGMSPGASKRERVRMRDTASTRTRRQVFLAKDDVDEVQSYVEASRRKMIDTLRKNSPGLHPTGNRTTSKLEKLLNISYDIGRDTMNPKQRHKEVKPRQSRESASKTPVRASSRLSSLSPSPSLLQSLPKRWNSSAMSESESHMYTSESSRKPQGEQLAVVTAIDSRASTPTQNGTDASNMTSSSHVQIHDIGFRGPSLRQIQAQDTLEELLPDFDLDQLKDKTLHDLQAYCREYGLPSRGTKSELIHRLIHSRAEIGMREETRRLCHGTLKGFGWGCGQGEALLEDWATHGPFHRSFPVSQEYQDQLKKVKESMRRKRKFVSQEADEDNEDDVTEHGPLVDAFIEQSVRGTLDGEESQESDPHSSPPPSNSKLRMKTDGEFSFDTEDEEEDLNNFKKKLKCCLAETYEETLKRKKQFEEIFQSDSEITRNLSLYPERDSSDSEIRSPRVDEFDDQEQLFSE